MQSSRMKFYRILDPKDVSYHPGGEEPASWCPGGSIQYIYIYTTNFLHLMFLFFFNFPTRNIVQNTCKKFPITKLSSDFRRDLGLLISPISDSSWLVNLPHGQGLGGLALNLGFASEVWEQNATYSPKMLVLFNDRDSSHGVLTPSNKSPEKNKQSKVWTVARWGTLLALFPPIRCWHFHGKKGRSKMWIMMHSSLVGCFNSCFKV